MEQHEANAQRAAAIQPQANIDFVTKEAREQSKRVAPEDLQREMLAQIYVQNHYAQVQNKELTVIKGHLLFQTIIYLLGIFGAIALYDTLSRLNF